MTIRATKAGQRREQGIMLFECIVYIGLFFVIVGLALNLFYVCWDNAKGFQRNADEIVGTLRIGERWRADVRTATGQLRAEASASGTVLHIPQRRGEIDYRFSDGAVWRRSGLNGEWMSFLPGLKSSRMEADKRGQVTAWRWEVELSPHRRDACVRPLFTFEAVPPHTN